MDPQNRCSHPGKICKPRVHKTHIRDGHCPLNLRADNVGTKTKYAKPYNRGALHSQVRSTIKKKKKLRDDWNFQPSREAESND